MKHKIFAANWKMYKTPDETRQFFEGFKSYSSQGEVVFFPPALCVDAALQTVKGSKIQIGVQNAYMKAEGAFTGEISAAAAQKMGCQYVLLGHSERRTYFHETDEMIGQKLNFVQSLGLKVMLCIGETLDQRKANQTEAVLKTQLEKALAKADPKNLVIAYEPVWAIGTGVNATPEQAEETHQFVAGWLEKNGYAGTPILYGGSVKPENAAQLMEKPHINGFLVGGASLDPESFKKICAN